MTQPYETETNVAIPCKNKIMIVGEAWGEKEAEARKPFVGPSGFILDGMLQAAGINRNECYLTNVFNLRPPSNRIELLCGPESQALPNYRALTGKKFIRKEFAPEISRLMQEIDEVNPNVIIAFGNTALWALTKKVGIKNYRGSPINMWESPRKVIPTWHPAAVMRQWKLRPIAIADMMKARRESKFPGIVRTKREIWIEPTIEDIEEFYHRYIVPAKDLSVDIETKNLTITEIGFACDEAIALVIPFFNHDNPGNYWKTFAEEKIAWQWVERILEEKRSFGQNFQYDMKYLWAMNAIPCPWFCDDTMLMQHTLQPEMEKGLGFLGSIYTNEPSWKLMRSESNDTMKKED